MPGSHFDEDAAGMRARARWGRLTSRSARLTEQHLRALKAKEEAKARADRLWKEIERLNDEANDIAEEWGLS